MASRHGKKFQNLLPTSYRQIINRPNIEEITAGQLYDIFYQFRERCLTQEERELPPLRKHAAYKAKVEAIGFSGRDPALDMLVHILTSIAEGYAKDEIPAKTLAVSPYEPQQSAIIRNCWDTLDAAKKSDDAVLAEVASNLLEAIYAVLPAQNNLSQPGEAGFRRINTTKPRNFKK